MRLILASGNRHKQRELQQLLPTIELRLAVDVGCDFSCAETGTSYQENAQLKAWTLYRRLGCPVLADDSGLEVTALGGRPGIHTARYGGGGATSGQQIDRLLAEMAGVGKREAFFVCGLAVVVSKRRFVYLQHELAGEISQQPSGGGGFGYDPVFYLPAQRCTLAELTVEEKNSLSHRAGAARQLGAVLAQLDR